MRELRYLSSAVFFIVMLFLLWIAWEHIGPYINTIVQVVIAISLASFVVLMASVSLSVWRAFSISGKVEELKAKIVQRVPRKRDS